MGQKKLIRFEQIKSFSNVLQYPEGIQGKWNDFFSNPNPITLELACGKGEYCYALSKIYPERNFIGVDLKGNRIYVGASRCLKEHIQNAAFLRTAIDQINTYFNKDEVEEIWITFPDPQVRTSRAKKRLTHPRFLQLYQQIIIPGGFIHLKTDSPLLYQFTRFIIERYKLTLHEFYEDLYATPDLQKELEIKTHYEGLDIAESRKIFYLRFSLPAAPIPEKDPDLQELLKEKEMAY